MNKLVVKLSERVVKLSERVVILMFLCLSLSSYSQNQPTYNSYQYYFSNEWSMFYTNRVKLSLHLIINDDSSKVVWLENSNLKTEEFDKLMKYLDTIPDISIGSRSFSSKDKQYAMDSFSIYWKKNNADTYDDTTNRYLNIMYIREKIKEFFK
jgi:hypothetical protein